MENSSKPPRWIILYIIFMTAILGFVVLAKIWFPESISDDVFIKIMMTFGIMFIGSAVIAITKKFLKNSNCDSSDSKSDDKK